MRNYSQIKVETSGGITTITLNRADKRNALSPGLIDEFVRALENALEPECSVVILTGAGQSFCAGLDLEHLESLSAEDEAGLRCDSENMARALRALFEFPKPVIAAVNGSAIAGGMSLATIADFTLAVPEAKFGFNEVRVGFVPAIEASFLLRQVGEKRTRDLLLTGRMLKAQEAQQLGLVTQIVFAEELMQTARALAQGLLLNSPQAMQATKRLLAIHAQHRLDAEIEDAIEINAKHRSTEDFREGVEAFLEHRKPCWPSKSAKI
ncbi:MAG: enoyl-CoA hydratase-related protein [Terracidiphilus sp.]|nr:enoyl-CoA hydratase-related protein [Terracidiphilus sp.]